MTKAMYGGEATLAVEAAFGYGPFDDPKVWTDISDLVIGVPGYTFGRNTEFEDFQPGGATVNFHTPNRELDPSYGPAKATFTGAGSNYWSAGDLALFSGATQLEFRAAIAPSSWIPASANTILAQNSGAGSRAFLWSIDASGYQSLTLSHDGTASTTVTSGARVAVVAGQLVLVAVTWDSGTGETYFYIKRTTAQRAVADIATDLSTWTLLNATAATGLTSSLFNSTAAVVVGAASNGSSPLTGDVLYATATTTIGNPADLIFDPASAASTSATSWVATTGQTWTKTGSASTLASQGAYYRSLLPNTPLRCRITVGATTYDVFNHVVKKWPQSWPNLGADIVVAAPTVDTMAILANAPCPPTAYGIELAKQNNASLAANGYPTVVAYWPLTEQAPATAIGDVFGGTSGQYEGAVPSSQYAPMPAAVGQQARAFGAIGSGNASRAVVTTPLTPPEGVLVFGSFDMSFWVYVPAPTYQFDVIINLHGLSLAVVCDPSAGNAYAQIWNGDATSTFLEARTEFPLSTGMHHIFVSYSATAPDIYVDGALVNGAQYAAAGFNPYNWPTLYVSGHGQIGGCTVGHIGVGSNLDPLALQRAGLDGRNGDTGGERATWLLTAAGVPAALQSVTTDSTTYLGPCSGGGTYLSQMKETEQAEHGKYFIDGAGVHTFRSSLWAVTATNAITAQATFGDDNVTEKYYRDIAVDSASIDTIFNICTVTTTTGATVTYRDEASIEVFGERAYPGLGSVPLASAGDAWNLAKQIVTEHAFPRDRVPNLEVWPRLRPSSLFPIVLGLKIGELLTIKRRPAVNGQMAGTVASWNATAEGGTFTFDLDAFSARFNLSPARPTASEQMLWTIGDSVLGIIDSAVTIPY